MELSKEGQLKKTGVRKMQQKSYFVRLFVASTSRRVELRMKEKKKRLYVQRRTFVAKRVIRTIGLRSTKKAVIQKDLVFWLVR